jgi:Eco57I restriction-modification methylase
MNKKELKTFAVEARRNLLEKVALKAEQYGVTENNPELTIEESFGKLIVNGKEFPLELKHALNTLKKRLNTVGYEQLIEEVAYTWFNRIIAIRYMEVNNYLPDRVNVLSSSTGKAEPDILLQYETMNLDVDNRLINEWLQKGDYEQAYRKIFIAQCNALNKILPSLFEKIEDYTELLLPDYLLDQESIIRKIVKDLSDENFYQIEEDGSKKDNVEVLGWLYQYYMSEKKEQVGGLKNMAVKKEDLPVVTQLFTPKWIVQYMLQNSLGKLYDEKYEDNQLAQRWEYYLKHEENHYLYPEFDSLEELKIIDPACGSGHILLYAFDMLYDMYEEAGYPSREIPQLILENNLYGLDIDKRAQQIAIFALLMKAAEKQPRFISRLSRKVENPVIKVYEIVDADQTLSDEAIDYFAENETEKSLIKKLMKQFENGKQFGSLIIPIEAPYKEWINRINYLENKEKDLIEESYFNELKEKLLPLFKQAFLLEQKYDVVVTNPPYHNKYNPILKKFMNDNYKDFKTDLYSAFIYITTNLAKYNGYTALMTPFTWMFINSHEKLRKYIISTHSITSLIQPEYHACYEIAHVPVCTFVIQNQHQYTIGKYIRLEDFRGAELQPIKVKEAVNGNVDYLFTADLENFSFIPGNPIAYWLPVSVIKLFNNKKLKDFGKASEGIKTGNNEKFIRNWFEININKIMLDPKNLNYKWVPYHKGGEYRKWYGNLDWVINWEEDGKEIKSSKNSGLQGKDMYFKGVLSWSKITVKGISIRYLPTNVLFDSGSPSYKSTFDIDFYIMGFLNSKVSHYLLESINPTLNLQVGNVEALPLVYSEKDKKYIDELVGKCIKLSKDYWDSFETSWDFKHHPLLKNDISNKLEEIYTSWEAYILNQRDALRKYEEELNEFFINLYGLRNELTKTVPDNYLSIQESQCEKEVKSFLSYFIGCLMGRYSLDIDGLTYAGGEFDESKYNKFKPNPDGLILLADDHYFENDIIVRLREFLSVAFSAETVDENLSWLAESLGMKKNESVEERLRRYFLDEFFYDHCKTYQKRPIYWLVDSGKQKGLRTLIYMHRYQSDTMATIRFDHLQEIQEKYQNEIEMIDTRLANPNLSATDRRNLEKSKTTFQKKIEELQEFDKHLAFYANNPIEIDLDVGVKVNYAKFDKVLAKIK